MLCLVVVVVVVWLRCFAVVPLAAAVATVPQFLVVVVASPTSSLPSLSSPYPIMTMEPRFNWY